MSIRARIIHRPVAGKSAAIAIHHAGMVGITVNIGITETRAHPLGLLLPVRWLGEILLFDGGIFFEGFLRAKQAPSGKDRNKTKGEGNANTREPHEADPLGSSKRSATSEESGPRPCDSGCTIAEGAPATGIHAKILDFP